MARTNIRTGIYRIVNTENGKLYIGSAVDIDRRWSSHRSTLVKNKHHCPHLQRAWNLYGSSGFIFEIVALCEPNDLLAKEQYYIDLADKDRLYNTHFVAKHWVGRKHTEESKRKMSEAHKANPTRGRRLAQLSKDNHAWLGRNHTENTKEKMSKSMSGIRRSLDSRARISLSKRRVALGGLQ